jgi:hypothetical protein
MNNKQVHLLDTTSSVCGDSHLDVFRVQAPGDRAAVPSSQSDYLKTATVRGGNRA